MDKEKFKNFKPTPEMVKAAQNLMLAMANLDYVKPIVQAYQREILERHQFPMPDEHQREFDDGGLPKTIVDPRWSFLLGPSDALVFYAQCHAARDAAGLKVDHPEACPKLAAENLVLNCQRALCGEMESITGLTWERVTSHSIKSMKEYIELCLRLLAPWVGTSTEILGQVLKGD